MSATPHHTNGHGTGTSPAPAAPRSRDEALGELTARPLTIDYRPGRFNALFAGDGDARFPAWGMLRDVERMLLHPDVALPYGYFKAGIATVDLKVTAGSADQAKFAHDALMKFWETSLDQAQLSYDYGWCGYEVCYRQERGRLHWDAIVDLHPLDTWAMTLRGEYCGISVKGLSHAGMTGRSIGKSGSIELWGPTHWPAKGLWLAHNRRWNKWYGQSQLFGAWRPWKRLATRDGAEEVIDGGIYRFAYRGPEVRYPPEDFRRKGGGELDYDAARNEARQLGEQAKAGVSIALPNTRDSKGEYKWSVNWPDGVLNVEPLLGYEKNLQVQIARGVGVPPELLEASESGSGWSGRKVPLLGFYQGQLKNARSIVRAFVRQVVEPLLRWNFGPSARCEVEVELKLPAAVSGEQAKQGGGGAPGAEQPGDAPGGDMAGLLSKLGGGSDEGDDEGQGQAGQQAPAEKFTLATSFTLTTDLGDVRRLPTTDPEDVLSVVLAGVRKLSRQAREELLHLLTTAPPDRAMGQVRRWAEIWQPRLELPLQQANLAALLEGMRGLADQIEPEVTSGEGSQGQAGVITDVPAWQPEDFEPLPLIVEAAKALQSKRVVGLEALDTLAEIARGTAAVEVSRQIDNVAAGVKAALSRAIDQGGSLATFEKEIRGAGIDQGILSPGHAETIFRTNVLRAYSDGQDRLLDQDGIGELFPYAEYSATHDARTRKEHRAMETLGIGGTAIYRRDDPVWLQFRPPWSFNCRCSWRPVSVKEAADRGIDEAREWLATGAKPAKPAWVAMPPFEADAAVISGREVDVTLATELSCAPGTSSPDVTTPEAGGADAPDLEDLYFLAERELLLAEMPPAAVAVALPAPSAPAPAILLSTADDFPEWHLGTIWLGPDGEWIAYEGSRGGKGWKHTGTKRVVYQVNKPGTRGKKETGENGTEAPGAPAAEKPTVDSVREKIAEMLKTKKRFDAADVHGLAGAMLGLTVAQLTDLKKQLGLKASGPKAELASKLAVRALAAAKPVDEEAEKKREAAKASRGEKLAQADRHAQAHNALANILGADHADIDLSDVEGLKRKLREKLGVANEQGAGAETGAGTGADDGGGSDGGDGGDEEAGGDVAAEAGRPASAGADQGGDTEGQPAGDAVTGGVPGDESAAAGAAPLSEVNKRIERYSNFFRAKGQHQVADWLGRLRDHVNTVGGQAALSALGAGAGGTGADGQPVQYWGVGTEEANWKNMGHFMEGYLARNGIIAVTGDTSSPDTPLVSALGKPDRYVAGQDFKPTNDAFKDKLDEAKHLPGLEKSEDLGTLMGKPVTHLSPDVTAKLDEQYGPGKWIVKCYSDEAAAGYGIFFPQRAAKIAEDARNTIWSAGEHLGKYGFKLGRNPDTGEVFGIVHESGDTYQFGTEEYEKVIDGDAKNWAEKARGAAANEKGAQLPEGKFMVQPAFEAVGISDSERAAGKTWHEKNEGRVHLVTRLDGKVEVVPHSTWLKGGNLPVVFEDDDTKAMAKAAQDAINQLPEAARKGQVYAPDVMKTKDGYKVVELNAQGDYNGSGYLHDNHFTIDSYVSHLTGREPAHVAFIRKLLADRKAAKPEKAGKDTEAASGTSPPDVTPPKADAPAEAAAPTGPIRGEELAASVRDDIRRDVERPATPAPAQATSGEKSGGAHPDKITGAMQAIKKESRGRLVPLDQLRKDSGLSREEFDAAMDGLRRSGRVTLTGMEGGRPGSNTADLHAAAIKDGDDVLAYADFRDDEDAAGAAITSPPDVPGPKARAVRRAVEQLGSKVADAAARAGKLMANYTPEAVERQRKEIEDEVAPLLDSLSREELIDVAHQVSDDADEPRSRYAAMTDEQLRREAMRPLLLAWENAVGGNQ